MTIQIEPPTLPPAMRNTHTWLCLCLLATLFLSRGLASAIAGDPVRLGDHPELILSSSQAWGELGWNTAAHAPGTDGAPLQIGDATYSSGLGHHAQGSITVLLEGEYAGFDAEVGLQPCGGGGSVVFRVYADGNLRFDSGTLRATDESRSVHVELAGARELRLEAADAGDGITCDVANWAEARLTRAQLGGSTTAEKPLDIAPFGRVVTWDPNRNDGCRADRLQEFRAEDVYLEAEAVAAPDGAWRPRVSTNGLGCIGLQWLNRRALRTLCLRFPPGSSPTTNGVRVEGWFGESAWQGVWKPLAGEVQASGSALSFSRGSKAGVLQTRKVRWIFPAPNPPPALRLEAYTGSRWATTNLILEAEKPAKGRRGDIGIDNGELRGGADSSFTRRVTFGKSLHLAVRYSRPSSLKSDPTVLRFRLPPDRAVAVAVEDVLSQGCVYLPQHGLFISCDPAQMTLAQYKRSIAGRQTILQQVRELPDQTLAQAMAKTHHAAQREGPVLLSLACDNAKFVVERDGTLRFQPAIKADGDWMASARELTIRLGTGPASDFSRALVGGWLPIPAMTVQHDGISYQQRVFVAPADEQGTAPGRLGRKPVCVLEVTATNTLPGAAPASIELRFPAGTALGSSDPSTRLASGSFAIGGGELRALLHPGGTGPLKCEPRGETLLIRGELRAQGSAQVALYLAYPPVDLATLPAPARLQAAVSDYWNAVLSPATQVETPEPFLNNLIRSSRVRCLIDARSEADFSRVAPWIAAMSYGPLESEAHSVIRGMTFLGHEEFARRGLDFFVHRYNTNGFLTTGYTTFGTGWHLWTLGEQFQLYQDTAWLRRHAPELERVGNWIVAQTLKTRHATAPESGLMPPGVLADWNAFACHFTLSSYYYAALTELGTALQQINRPQGKVFVQSAEELRRNILRAYRWTEERSPVVPLRNGAWVPYYPSQVHSPGKLGDFFPGQDVGRSWAYDVELGAHQLAPAGVLSPRGAEMDQMLDHMEDVQFLADGWYDYPATMNQKDWYNLGGFSKVQPYYTRNCEIYAMRDEVKPFIRSYFNSIASLLNPEVLTFWEHFHHGGAWDKTHETGYFLHQTRTMLLTERGSELWLAPMITADWLANGKTLSVSNAPTGFGATSYRLESRIAEGSIRATIVPPARNPPKLIVLRLRHPEGRRIQSVSVNGRRHSNFDPALGLLRLHHDGRIMDIRVLYGTR